jgi:adenosylcobinamide kinase/adenosylcobinamide-phosphate guanylyltransferase
LKTTLIIGGARSGKSRLAQEMAAAGGGEVLFVATAEAGDDEMERRIEAHRRSRPPDWRTLEVTTDVGGRITEGAGRAGTVVIDCVTLLVNNIFEAHGWSTDEARMEKAVEAEVGGLIACIDGSAAHFIIVTNEVGLGIIPADRASRLYRDLLGRANRLLAARADKVILMVAGIPVAIKQAGQPPD